MKEYFNKLKASCGARIPEWARLDKERLFGVLEEMDRYGYQPLLQYVSLSVMRLQGKLKMYRFTGQGCCEGLSQGMQHCTEHLLHNKASNVSFYAMGLLHLRAPLLTLKLCPALAARIQERRQRCGDCVNLAWWVKGSENGRES